jgi:hypothetical protein
METTTGSSFWFVLSACIGGVIVLVGLLMETLADKKWFGTLKSFRRCESIKHCGEWAVILGVLIEVVVAGWSAKDEWQTRQIAIKDSPLNQPIKSIQVHVFLEIAGTNFIQYALSKSAAEKLSMFEIINKNGEIAVLGCDAYSSEPWVESQNRNDPPNERFFSFTFSWPTSSWWAAMPIGPTNWMTEYNVSTLQLINDFKSAHISFIALASDFEIKKSSCEMIINGSIPVICEIPKHNSGMIIECNPKWPSHPLPR